MGEIKSSLDIIMEKTKGLTVSEEEKKTFQKDEVDRKVRGIFQKFLDGLMDLERAKMEVVSLGEERQRMAREALKKECLDRIDPEGDPSPFLAVLEHLAGVDPHPLGEILSEFQRDLETQKKGTESVLRKRLKKQGISGSAVIPNLKVNPEWIRYLSETREEFREKLESLICPESAE